MKAPSSISLFAIRKFWLWLFGIVVLHSSFLTSEAVASKLAKDKAKAVIEAQIEAMAIDELTVLLLQLYENVLVVRRDLKKWSLKDIKLSTGRVPFPSKVLKTLVLLEVLSFI